MATGRVYRIKKSAVKGYGYTSPPRSGQKRAQKRNGPRFAANGSVTHIAAINGRGSYRSARRTMSGLSANRRPAAARSSLSAAKKSAFARKMRGLKKNSSRRKLRRNDASPAQTRIWEKAASRHTDPWSTRTRRSKSKKRKPSKRRSPARVKRVLPTPSRRRKTTRAATRKKTMARRKVRRKKSARRSAPKRRVAKRRTVKRRRKAAKKTAAPKRRRRRAKRKTTLKANRRRRSSRRLRRNYGTTRGAKRGWRVRKRKYKATAYRKGGKKRRKTRKGVVRTKRRKLSKSKSAVAARRYRRKLSQGMVKKRGRKAKRKMASNGRKRRRSRRKMTSNRRRRSSRRRMSSNRRRRSSRRRSLSPNRRRRSSRRRGMKSNRRRQRRNGRRLFRKNGIGDTIAFIAKTGGLALLGLTGQKVLTNLLVNNVFNKIFGSPAVVIATPAATATVAPATSGLGGLSLDPQYQKLGAAFLVAGLGVFASTKLIKDAGTRNTVMTGIAVGFTHTVLSAILAKFLPAHADMLNGDGTAARLSAMYGFGAATSLQPRYQSIGRPMGEYFSSGMGEYFQGSGGLGEYFGSGVNGLGLPAYEAAAGYGANPDFAEAAAGMGARELQNTNHVDPHGDLDRELTIAEAAAGVGSLPSYEAAAGFGAVSTLPSSSTWIPGSSDGQIWAGTRSISQPQSASEMVPAGILQTDGGQGVFG